MNSTPYLHGFCIGATGIGFPGYFRISARLLLHTGNRGRWSNNGDIPSLNIYQRGTGFRLIANPHPNLILPFPYMVTYCLPIEVDYPRRRLIFRYWRIGGRGGTYLHRVPEDFNFYRVSIGIAPLNDFCNVGPCFHANVIRKYEFRPSIVGILDDDLHIPHHISNPLIFTINLPPFLYSKSYIVLPGYSRCIPYQISGQWVQRYKGLRISILGAKTKLARSRTSIVVDRPLVGTFWNVHYIRQAVPIRIISPRIMKISLVDRAIVYGRNGQYRRVVN